MSQRTASLQLRTIAPGTPLPVRDLASAGPDWDALEWQGAVRLDPERASTASAALWQGQVRRGLLERLLSLGADHVAGPHSFRPEVGRRMLAHLDALAEAGLTAEALLAFALEQDLEDSGTPFALALLFGCLATPDAPAALEAWLQAIDAAALAGYSPVVELGRALALAPNPATTALLQGFLSSPTLLARAVALEALSPEDVSDNQLAALAGLDAPLVWTALERLASRAPLAPARRLPSLPRWSELPPWLANEVVRARLARRELEPLAVLRQGDAAATSALGAHVLQPFALAGGPEDSALALELSRTLPTTPDLLSTLGLLGLPALFPRLLAALDDEDYAEDAHAALITALGPLVARPSVSAWEPWVNARSPSAALRLRGGEPSSNEAVCAEMARPELSALDVEWRADELFCRTGRRIQVRWSDLGVPLTTALSELSRLVR